MKVAEVQMVGALLVGRHRLRDEASLASVVEVERVRRDDDPGDRTRHEHLAVERGVHQARVRGPARAGEESGKESGQERRAKKAWHESSGG